MPAPPKSDYDIQAHVFPATRSLYLADAKLQAEALPFPSWPPYIRYAFRHAPKGLFCEFGVYMGGSLSHFIHTTPYHFHGFDSFIGLQEAWQGNPVGHLSLEGKLPKFKFGTRVTIHAGLFADTIPQFLTAYPGEIAFAHIDCDLYSSATTILELLRPRLVRGSVLVFDEYITGEADERQAFLETGLAFRYLCHHVLGGSVAVQLTAG